MAYTDTSNVPEGSPESALNVQVKWLRLLRLAGELDLASAPLVRQAGEILAAQPAQDLVIDLAEVSFVDASGLAALASLAHAQQSSGATLSFTAVPGIVRELCTLAGASVLDEAMGLTRSA